MIAHVTSLAWRRRPHGLGVQHQARCTCGWAADWTIRETALGDQQRHDGFVLGHRVAERIEAVRNEK